MKGVSEHKVRECMVRVQKSSLTSNIGAFNFKACNPRHVHALDELIPPKHAFMQNGGKRLHPLRSALHAITVCVC
jgi:hypothetical protein